MEELVLHSAPRRRRHRWLLRRLHQFLGAYDRATIVEWDGTDLDAAVAHLAAKFGWNRTLSRGVRTYIDALKCHPTMDPEGLYRSHRRYVPRAFLEAHPGLCAHPVNLARFGLRLPDPADVDAVVVMADRLFENLDRSNKAPARTRRRCVRVLLETLQHALTQVPTVRALVATPDAAAAADLVARVVVHRQRLRPQTSHLPTPSLSVLDRTLRAFNLFVRCGLFPSVVDPIARASVTVRLHAAPPPRFEQRFRRHLTDAAVEELRSHCRTAREVAIFELLRCLGLRAEAVECACLADVWCDATGSLHDTMHFLEKNSKVRRARPCEPLASALAIYIRGTPELRRAAFLFPHPHRLHDRCRGLARNFMRSLCRRAYGPTQGMRYTPHLFRHWIVNEAKRQGRPMEVIARWLGHAHPSTTSRYYWTDEVTDLWSAVPNATPLPAPLPPEQVVQPVDGEEDPMWA